MNLSRCFHCDHDVYPEFDRLPVQYDGEITCDRCGRTERVAVYILTRLKGRDRVKAALRIYKCSLSELLSSRFII